MLDPRNKWLNLSEVAKLLGVHPSTVRNWADQGRIPVHRTQGGHRRFLQGELELWNKSQNATTPEDATLVIQSALGYTRIQIGEGMLEAEGWYAKLDEDARDSYRRSGRQLMQGLIAFLSSTEEEGAAEAHAIGHDYASMGRRYKLESAEAARAFLFFRNALLESMLKVYESAAVHSAFAWSDMMRRINTFTDQILITLLETYQIYDGVNKK